MEKPKVITDHKWKNFLYGYELTKKERAEFDWMNSEEIEGSLFIRYRKTVYALGEFMAHRAPFDCVPEDSPLASWHGHRADSFFSAVVIRVSNDGEQYQIGTMIS